KGAEQEDPATRVGAHRELPATLPGAWTTDELNEKVWRVELRSPDAVAMRLHFTDFHLPSGSVTIFEPDPERRPVSERRYEGDGPGGDGEMWSDLIEGDSVIIEYRPADGQPGVDAPPFRIDKISHLWQSPLDAF